MKARLFLLQALLIILAQTAPAQKRELIPSVPLQGVTSKITPQLVIHAIEEDMNTRVPPPPGSRFASPTATIDVTYIGFPSQAEAAFAYAVDIWETLITSTSVIKITARWTPLEPNVLGSASASSIWRDFGGAPQPGTWYPVALAEALTGGSLNDPDTADINANFNSNQANWYFGTDGNPASGQYDMVSVVLHELGHGLGFFGSLAYSGGTGSWGATTDFPFIFDRFVENGSNQKLINTSVFPNPSTALGTELISNNIFFDGLSSTSANGGTPPKLYCPSTWIDGSSFSHLDETTYPAGNPNSLMTPSIGTSEVIHSPGDVCLAMFEDWGWSTTPPAPSNIKWEEQFTSTSIPPGWRVVDNDGSGGFFSYIGALIAGPDTLRAQAGSSFWWSSFNNANNDDLIDEWIISPRVQGIEDGDSLYFWAGASDQGFDDSLKVFISTTDSLLGSFTNQIGYFKVNGPFGSWNRYGFDISGFAGSDIFVAVNYFLRDGGPFGGSSDNVWIDHFLITSPTSNPSAGVTTSVLQNPALSKYADIVVVSENLLDTTPVVDAWINTDTTRLVMSLLPGTDRSYSGGYEFTQSGTYTLSTTVVDSGVSMTFVRTFGVVLARPGVVVAIEALDDMASLTVLENSIIEETYFLSDYSESGGTRAYQFGPAKEFPDPLLLEITYDPLDYPREEGLTIYREGIDGWQPVPGQVLPRTHTVRALVSTLGSFRIGYDSTATVNNLIPSQSSLSQNYPNPFNPSTTIHYDVANDGPVTLAIYDIQGRKIKVLYDGFRFAGSHSVEWDGTNRDGNHVASGVYFYRLQTDGFFDTRKLILLR